VGLKASSMLCSLQRQTFWVTGSPWSLHWPSHMKTHHGNEEWEAVMEMAKEDARRVPLPPDLFEV